MFRVRVPGGQLQAQQIRGLGDFAAAAEIATLQITNRANIQLRGLKQPPHPQTLSQLQTLGLGAKNPAVDVLRNMMLNPLAGLDATELVDFSPWLPELEDFLATQPGLEQLPAKFSLGLDGGGQCSAGWRSLNHSEHRYNEIQLTAVSAPAASELGLRLDFGIDKGYFPSGVWVDPSQGLPMLKALILAYRDYVQAPDAAPKARLRDLLADWGTEKFLAQAQSYLDFPLSDCSPLPSPQFHPGQQYLGVHSQADPDLAYIGIGLPQGQATLTQWRGLGAVAETFGSGELRLTPWHALIVVNILQVNISQALAALESLGFPTSPTITQGIVACPGKLGCGAGQTDTLGDAQRLGTYLKQQPLSRAVNIHLTACPKACAQPSPAEFTLLGMPNQMYRFYDGDFRQASPMDEAPLEHLLPLIYQRITASGPVDHVSAPHS